MPEAFKIIVYPHGKVMMEDGQIVNKYLLGGVLLSDKEVSFPSEGIVMDGGANQIIDVLEHSKCYIPPFKLGQIGSAMHYLQDLTPENCDLTAGIRAA